VFTLLIADDSAGKTLMLKTLIKKSGIETDILTATTTDTAKQLIDSHTIDAAFVDYEMPTENGPAVIAYLRNHQPEARITLASSSDNSTRQAEAIEAGAETCICTSYAPDTVEETVLNLLESWK